MASPTLEQDWLRGGLAELRLPKLHKKLTIVRTPTTKLSTDIQSQFFWTNAKAFCIPRSAIQGIRPAGTNDDFLDRHIMIEKLADVVKHVAAEPWPEFGTLPIDGKDQKGSVVRQKYFDLCGSGRAHG